MRVSIELKKEEVKSFELGDMVVIEGTVYFVSLKSIDSFEFVLASISNTFGYNGYWKTMDEMRDSIDTSYKHYSSNEYNLSLIKK